MIAFATRLSPLTPVLLVASLVLAGLGWRKIWPLWRHGRRLAWRRDYYTEERRAAIERSAPAAAVGVTAMVLALAFPFVLGTRGAGAVGLLVFAAAAVVCSLLCVTTHLWAWPRWAVPPVRRGDRDG